MIMHMKIVQYDDAKYDKRHLGKTLQHITDICKINQSCNQLVMVFLSVSNLRAEILLSLTPYPK